MSGATRALVGRARIPRPGASRYAIDPGDTRAVMAATGGQARAVEVGGRGLGAGGAGFGVVVGEGEHDRGGVQRVGRGDAAVRAGALARSPAATARPARSRVPRTRRRSAGPGPAPSGRGSRRPCRSRRRAGRSSRSSPPRAASVMLPNRPQASTRSAGPRSAYWLVSDASPVTISTWVSPASATRRAATSVLRGSSSTSRAVTSARAGVVGEHADQIEALPGAEADRADRAGRGGVQRGPDLVLHPRQPP